METLKKKKIHNKVGMIFKNYKRIKNKNFFSNL